MKSVIRNILKVAFCCLLAVFACIAFFDYKPKTSSVPVLAEQTVENTNEQSNLIPDENGLLNLEKWEDYALSDFNETSEGVATGMGFSRGTSTININVLFN